YDVTIAGQTITGGHAQSQPNDFGNGGGILSSDSAGFICGDFAALTLRGVHVVGNHADANAALGGGVAVAPQGCFEKAPGAPGADEGDLNIIDSTVSGNVASGAGGGVAMHGFVGSLFVSNSTIVGNTSGGVGGGIAVFPNGDRKVETDDPNTY